MQRAPRRRARRWPPRSWPAPRRHGRQPGRRRAGAPTGGQGRSGRGGAARRTPCLQGVRGGCRAGRGKGILSGLVQHLHTCNPSIIQSFNHCLNHSGIATRCMPSSPAVPTRVLCPDAGGADVCNDLAVQYSPRVHDAPQRLVSGAAGSRHDVGGLLHGRHIPLGAVDLAAASVQLGRQRVAACRQRDGHAGGGRAPGTVRQSSGLGGKQAGRGAQSSQTVAAQLPGKPSGLLQLLRW